jgi:hypothetical protein
MYPQENKSLLKAHCIAAPREISQNPHHISLLPTQEKINNYVIS